MDWPGFRTSSSVITAREGAPVVSTGASFTGVTLKVMVLREASVSTPPTAVPPASCTRKPKLARPAPLRSAAGV